MSWWFTSKSRKEAAQQSALPSASDRLAELHELSTGGAEAIAAIYRRYGKPVYRFAYALTASREAAEETTQEVFLFLLREWRRYDPARGPLEAWLLGITRRLARRHAPHGRFRALEDHVDPQVMEAAPQGGVLQELLQREVRERLHQAIAGLPDTYRDALVMQALEGYSYDQVAAELGCPVGTVRSRIARAKDLLGKHLLAATGAGDGRLEVVEPEGEAQPTPVRKGGNHVR